MRALDEAAAGEQSLGESFRRGNTSTALLVTAVAAATAVGADLSLGVAAGTALTAGAVVGIAGAVATVAKVTALHLPAANRRAGELGRPGGPEQLKLQWLSALEVRGVRPFLEQQRAVAAAARAARPVARPAPRPAPQLRGTDRSAEARRRSALEHSFGQLPAPAEVFAGRRSELTRIAQWVQAARASAGDPAGGGAARGAGRGAYDAGTAGCARAAGPVPGRVRGGPAGRFGREGVRGGAAGDA
ncbi:hypothetical protein SAVIM40S_04831 [Streptomyces avidinii]